MGSAIVGCGKALPALEVQNDDLKALVDTNDEWIVTRTGISSRHIAVSETNAGLAEAAAREALGWTEGGWSQQRIKAESIDLIVYATITPDTFVPSASALLRKRLELPNAIAFDLNAACTGFVYGLTVAEAMMAASAPEVAQASGRNPIRRALVVGSERLSRLTDWANRGTCVLFGDGAGAAVLEWDSSRSGILGSFITNADDVSNSLTCPNDFAAPLPFGDAGIMSYDEAPADPSKASTDAELGICEALEAGENREVIRMDGQKVFKFAAEAMTTAIHQVLDRADLTLDDIACVVPHQANERIIKYAAKKIGRPMDFFQLSIAHAGNTSSASVPMALSDAYTSGRIKRGDKVIVVAFGGGLTSGAVLFEA